ncbi:MAG: protoporphyrinogen oxidase [Planctomycetota bacterium]|nr:protoporphyrinogen oxidase [Planctomycetota bacterium]
MTAECSTTDLLVVGAGPAGLAHAFWRLRAEPQLEVRVLEQQAQAGGWVQTKEIDGYTCEIGPQGIRPNDDSEALLSALGIEDKVVPANPLAKHRFLARDRQLHPLPNGPGDLLATKIFTLAGKLSLCMEPFRRRRSLPDESLAGFVARRLGPQAVPLAEALANGVFGGDAHTLEMAAAFPAIKELETKHGSLLRGMLAGRKARQGKPKRPALHSFCGGMHTIIQALSDSLGDRLLLSTGVVALAQEGDGWSATLANGSTMITRELALAVPSRVAAELLGPTCRELALELKKIPFASIANVYLGYPRADVEEQLAGFGYLIDRRDASPMLGTIYCSSIFPGCAPGDEFLVRVMAGGVMRLGALDESDDTIVQQADTMLRSYTGLSAPRVFERVCRTPGAIPQYTLGHSQRIARIRNRVEALPNLHLLGNSYDAVSVVGQLRTPQSRL